jgi:tripartite ATP-independent transporter DctM subunit
LIATGTLVLLFAMLAVGAPVGFAMLVSGALGLYWIAGWNGVLIILSTTPRAVGSTFEFLTIPMFLLMAELVLRSGVADDLFAAASAWFGRIRGGLGIATALAGAGFGAVCGSSTAAAATLSSSSLPAMLKYNYKPDMAGGVVAISGTLSMLIPPSVAMIVYGLLADVSIAKMLIAGVIPGIVVALAIALTVYFLAWQDPSRAPLAEPVPFRERVSLLGKVGPMLLLMGAVTGSIYAGVATATEASALGALIAAVLYFWRGKRTRAEIYAVVARSARNSCMIGVIILGAHIFSTFFALTQTTQSLVEWVGTLGLSTVTVLIALVIIYIILGCFMDQMAILVLTVPVVTPLLMSMDVDLIWFGVILIVTAELGMVTPPFGLNVFVVSKYSGIPVGTAFRGTVPHVIAHVIVIAIFMIFPALVMWLPNHVN